MSTEAEMIYDLVVIGAGPGGLQAAIAAGSEGMNVLVLEKGMVGGQIGQTPLLENSVFSGGGITGPEFAAMMRKQAEAMGATITQDTIIELKRDNGSYIVVGQQATYLGHAVILAMGNRWGELDIPGVKALVGKAVHYGPVKSIRHNAADTDVAVYGGGPSAGQAIIALAKEPSTRKVQVLMRSTLKMPQYLVDAILKLVEDDRVQLYDHVTIRRATPRDDGQIDLLISGEAAGPQKLIVSSVFMCNGLTPATEWLPKIIQKDKDGRVLVGLDVERSREWLHEPGSMETSLPAVYAIGDCRSGSTARVGVAIGDGSMAVTELWQYFAKHPVCRMCKQFFPSAHKR
jgi:thioredoxin reductase (NADPH)